MAKKERPLVPTWMLERLRAILDPLPRIHEEDAWVGVRWRVGGNTVVHVFGGEDQLFRIVFRGEPDEVAAFEHLGAPYFRAGWGRDVIGMIIDEDSDWTEVRELLVDSFCLMAPDHLAAQVDRPG
ncbi:MULTISPECIES: MmcQ/YjbR family DNA-binding protein [unclassified Nocardioides]|uniref:MmcQ/YjbR family DNA-binding protein n=1 Tax=unclassified Nocardioides TaxID=2615069 RepID=UPI0007009352|nr:MULTISPECIES: MmcQ/YjbR family DNA-binding protein [unclassified Nocardioides]KQY62608.1 hypothetical protein ASD30_23085 [Nocardioides sp. Root140]KQZ75992.1 hypothetical protein ASD66_06780 [Nocardioides sp. Root151]KRF15065.1 hypothetical protein ASH02_12555 [Nocardioides sp. Soil796]